jgi:hypothetical protein
MACDVTAWIHTAMAADKQRDCTNAATFWGVRTDGGFPDQVTVSL